MIAWEKNAAETKEENITVDTIKSTEVVEERNTTAAVKADMDVTADAAAIVDVTATVTVPVDIRKVLGENSNPKKRRERNWKSTKKSWNTNFKP